MRLLVVISGLLIATGLPVGAPAADPVPVGVARVDITPEWPVRMYGYGARKTESEGVAGRLKASALAIGADEGQGPAVLLAVDCGAVPASMRQEVFDRVTRKVRLQPERFVLANSHNHSGPDLKGMGSMTGEEHEHLARYARELSDRLERVVLEALDSRQPGRLAWARGSVHFASNRRVLKGGKWTGFGAVPEAPTDPALPLLKITTASGKLLAVVANYACHCTTLRGNFTKIHGDWAACAREYIEADHPGARALITLGCGADADPHPHGTVELCEKHGRALADEVKRLLGGPMTPVPPGLTARRKTLEIPYEKLPPTGEFAEKAKNSTRLKRILERLERGEKPPSSESFQIATWVFGDALAMVFFSDEVVVDYVLRLKRELDSDRLWITAYADDVSRYIVSRRLLREGGYEVQNSLSNQVSFGQPGKVEPAMEDRIVDAVKSLLPAGYQARGKAE